MEDYFIAESIKALDLDCLSKSELGLEIHLDNNDGFIGYASVTLVKDGERHEFTSEQFLEGMRRLAHTAKVVDVPRRDYEEIGHYECGACGTPIGLNNHYCHHCGARLVVNDG